jgi:hypothetical protein
VLRSSVDAAAEQLAVRIWDEAVVTLGHVLAALVSAAQCARRRTHALAIAVRLVDGTSRHTGFADRLRMVASRPDRHGQAWNSEYMRAFTAAPGGSADGSAADACVWRLWNCFAFSHGFSVMYIFYEYTTIHPFHTHTHTHTL